MSANRAAESPIVPERIIRPSGLVPIDFGELIRYRELFWHGVTYLFATSKQRLEFSGRDTAVYDHDCFYSYLWSGCKATQCWCTICCDDLCRTTSMAIFC